MNCPNCNSVNAPSSPFCVHCGTLLPQMPQNTQPQPHPAATPNVSEQQFFTPGQSFVQEPVQNVAPQPARQPFRQPPKPVYQPPQEPVRSHSAPSQYDYSQAEPNVANEGYAQYDQQPPVAPPNSGYVVNGVEYPSMSAAADALRGNDQESDDEVFYPFSGQQSASVSSRDRQKPNKGEWTPRVGSKKKAIFGVVGVVAVLALLIFGAIALFGGSGFTEFNHVGMPFVNDGKIQIVSGTKMLSGSIDGESVSDGQYSLDGKVLALLTDEDKLYVVKGKDITKIADEVIDIQISTTGKGIAYVTEGEDDGYVLYLYNVGTKKIAKVSEAMSTLGFAVSPDGKTVAYYVEGDDNAELMFYDGSKSSKITASETMLAGISNGGKYIYAVCDADDGEMMLYSYNKKGERAKLGEIDSGSVYFNEDHTQVLFYCEDKTYISAKGKESVKASSDELRLIVPDNCNSFSDRTSITYPVDSLYDHAYVAHGDSSNSAWLIKKNADKSVKLASKVSSVTLSQDGKYLYYVHDYEELCVLKVSDGDKASDNAIELCDDLSNYIVTPNRSKVYYISDGCLYSVNGKKGGKPTEVAEDVENRSLAVSKKNVVYYIVDDELYACSNGKSGERVLDDCETVYNTPNGTVYASNEDTLYGTTGSKKLDKIAEIE